MNAMTAKTIREGSLGKRLLALLLALAAAVVLSLAIAPAAALADEAVSFGGSDIEAGDQVYLGEWENAPIAWDVESASSSSIAVHSTYILFKAMIDSRPDPRTAPELTLETSELYTSTLPNFKGSAFSGGEIAIPGHFVLSGDFGGATFPDGKGEWYWINEPIYESLGTTYHDWCGWDVGSGDDRYTDRVGDEGGVRPASTFDLTPVLFSSAAEGGKSGDAAGEFSELSDTSSVSAWKLTLRDDSRAVSASAASKTTVAEGYSSWVVPVTFSGGGTDANDYVSAILCDANGSALYYGTVAKAAASGTQDMEMPTGLVEGAYTLKVFSEQRNGDKATDYAGAFEEITLTVEAAPAEYAITFVNDDGTELQTGQVAYGETPEYTGKTPTKDDEGAFTYTFAGWSDGTKTYAPDVALPVVTGEATYKAVYDKAVKTATLKFDLTGGTLDGKTGTVTVEANVGDTVKLPDAPTKDGYTFKCWKGSEYAAGAEYKVEGDHSFTAEWEKNADSGTTDSTKATTPKTGDGNGVLVIGLSVAAFVAVCVIAAYAVRRRRDS